MSVESPKKILEAFGLTPKHSFGQNFLSDAHLAEKIARLATPRPGLHVLELGAGLGALTSQLLDRCSRVVAVERDRDLVPPLNEIFKDHVAEGRLQVLEADAKSLDWASAMAQTLGADETPPEAETPGLVIAGNLPYQITGPLLEKTVQLGNRLELAVFLVQKEVADRLAAGPGTKTYGALSVFVQAQFSVRRAFVIKPGAFFPQPRVDSAVVVFTPLKTPWSEETPVFRNVVKSAFLARRKTLRNAWKSLCPVDELGEIAASCDISLDQRGETLSVEQFAQMSDALGRWRRILPPGSLS